jgi:galactonate dehydratase
MKIERVELLHADTDEINVAPHNLTFQPSIKDGCLQLPTGPSWGTQINEAAVKAHPPRRR